MHPSDLMLIIIAINNTVKQIEKYPSKDCPEHIPKWLLDGLVIEKLKQAEYNASRLVEKYKI